MRIAVPTEVMDQESRVGITPVGVRELVSHGHQVFLQAGAGRASGFLDADYADRGAVIVDAAADTWAAGDLVLKVKEPVAEEYPLLRSDLVLFTYLHLAANRPCTEALLAAGTTAIAYETVQLPTGLLPLLHPMSEVAGHLAPHVGAHVLMAPSGGMGILMGSVPGVARAKVVIVGGGTAGQNAARTAIGMGAEVTILDTDLDKLQRIFWHFDDRVSTIYSSQVALQELVPQADLVIGTVLVPGDRAPKLVTDAMVAAMKPGSVLVDVAIDQGGCFEGSRPTTHTDPTFRVHESLFYCVTNMPGAVPRTSTSALTNATLPYVRPLAGLGWQQALRASPALARGLNTHAGAVTFPAVATAHDLPHRSVQEILER